MRDSTPLLHFGPAGNATPPPPSESTAVALQYTAVLHALQLLLYLSLSCVSRQFGAPEFGEGPASLSPVVLDARDLSLDSEMAADVDLLGARGSHILDAMDLHITGSHLELAKAICGIANQLAAITNGF